MSTETETKGAETDELDLALDEARKRKAARDLKHAEADKRHELERLQLVERFESETGGPEGDKFAIVDAGSRGFLVLKLGMAVTHKTWNLGIEANKKAKIGGESGITPETCHKFVKACVVHPSIEEFKAIVEEREGLLYTAAGQLDALYSANREAARGKF